MRQYKGVYVYIIICIFVQFVSVSISGVSDQGWVLGNVKQMGYYRVNYDLDNWERLITQLQSDHTVGYRDKHWL